MAASLCPLRSVLVLLLAAVIVVTVSGNASVGPAAAPAVIPAPDDTATGIEPAAAAGPTMAGMNSAAGPGDAFGDGDAFAPTSMEADTELWPQCKEAEGNLTHSLMGIVRGEFQNKTLNGFPSVLLPLLENVDEPTREILNSFSLESPGHTLLLPENVGVNFTDLKRGRADILAIFGIDPNTTSTEVATEIVRAHLIPETLTYIDLVSRTETGLDATFTSLQGLPWSFAWRLNAEKTEGFLVLQDLYTVTNGQGYLQIEVDITNTPQGFCPNAIFSIDGFLAVPAFLQTNITAPVGPPIVDPNFVPPNATTDATVAAPAAAVPDAMAPSALVAGSPAAADAPVGVDDRGLDPVPQTATDFNITPSAPPSNGAAGGGRVQQRAAVATGVVGALISACIAVCA